MPRKVQKRVVAANTNTASSFQLTRLFPNMVTIIGLCAGLSSLRFALHEKWELAAAFIIIAAFIDAVDGRLARMLNSTSSFGAHLDSLADFLNFGVAPVFALYLWKTSEIKGLGWALVLFFAVCAVIRLARFNTDLETDKKDKKKDYFVGIPAPAGALIVLSPMIFDFALKLQYPELFAHIAFTQNPYFVCALVAFTAILMASRIPTFSFKNIKVPKKLTSLILAATGLLAIGFMSEPWLVLCGIITLYILTIPISIVSYLTEK